MLSHGPHSWRLYRDGGLSTALSLFGAMPRSPVVLNDFTFVNAIKACLILSNLRNGEKFHAYVEILVLELILWSIPRLLICMEV